MQKNDVDVDLGDPQEWKKYSSYSVNVDPDQDDKATEIKLCDFSRPHMRAFHVNWFGFFMAFCIWFAIAPLLTEIKKTLNLTKQDVWTSSIVAVSGTICMRFILGPLCDKFGPRVLFAAVLCLCSIPTACTGFVNSSPGLSVLRLFIGLAGGSFVMCQFWASRMFTKEVVGVTNALVAGWGNLGGGATQLIVGSVLFPLFKKIFNGDAEKAWRTVCVVPAFISFATGVAMYYISDDAPKGNYNEMKKHGAMPEISAVASFRSGAVNFNSWLMFVQYGCCFGVELTMYNAAALYFKEEFGQSTESAAAIASIFGWMNLVSRGLGGFVSDKLNARMGMRGRILAQTLLLASEGALVIIFSQTKSLAGSICVMVVFSFLVQGAAGSTFGIVPYIDPPCTGSISGIVGAGGNCGALGFGFAFRQLSYEKAFLIMGFTVLGSACLSAFIKIKGRAALLWGEDSPELKKGTLTVPEPEAEIEEIHA